MLSGKLATCSERLTPGRKLTREPAGLISHRMNLPVEMRKLLDSRDRAGTGLKSRFGIAPAAFRRLCDSELSRGRSSNVLGSGEAQITRRMKNGRNTDAGLQKPCVQMYPDNFSSTYRRRLLLCIQTIVRTKMRAEYRRASRFIVEHHCTLITAVHLVNPLGRDGGKSENYLYYAGRPGVQPRNFRKIKAVPPAKRKRQAAT